MTTTATLQPNNKNLMPSLGFRMTFLKIPNVTYFLQGSGIPGISFGSPATISTPFKNIPETGDKLEWNDLEVNFIVDEDMDSWFEIWDWMIGIGFPENFEQYAKLQGQSELNNPLLANQFLGGSKIRPEKGKVTSDATLIILNSNNVPVREVTFKDIWPFSISDLAYDSKKTDIEYLTATAVFKYTIYSVRKIEQS